jgi:hypothetical protein
VLGLLALAATLALSATARAVTCPQQTIKDALAGADVAFVGRLVSRTPLPTGNGVPLFTYRFVVDQDVKGVVGRHVTVRAATLVDLDGKELTPEAELAVGVLATSSEGRLVSSSCGLVDAGSLLGAADEPKGGPIKIVIGVVLLALVLAYSFRRLKRRSERERARAS